MFNFDVEAHRDEVDRFVAFIRRHKDMDGALMPVLQKAQTMFGYIAPEIVEIIAEHLEVPTSEVYGVASFYSQFSFVPRGKFAISVCMGTACYVNGAQDILDTFISELGIGIGETTRDMMFSIIETRCVGACDGAPVVMVNGMVYPHFKKSAVKDLIHKLRQDAMKEEGAE